MKSYVRHRGVYAAQLLPQLGIPMADVKKSKDMCASQIKELTGFDHLQDLFDSAMVTAGEKVYDDVRDQLIKICTFPCVRPPADAFLPPAPTQIPPNI